MYLLHFSYYAVTVKLCCNISIVISSFRVYTGRNERVVEEEGEGLGFRVVVSLLRYLQNKGYKYVLSLYSEKRIFTLLFTVCNSIKL